MEQGSIRKMHRTTLDELYEGERGSIAAIPCDHPLSQRLKDMGWVTGSEVVCLYRAPSGDPVAYRVAGVTVALRHCDAASIGIFVQRDDDSDREEASVDDCIYGAYGDYGGEDDVGNLLKGGDTYETAR